MKRTRRRRLTAWLLVLGMIFAFSAMPTSAGQELQAQDGSLQEDFLRWYTQGAPTDFIPEDVTIEVDYGSYPGGRVVLLSVAQMQMTDDLLELEIGGHLFVFPSGAQRDLFLLYHDGTFTRVQEAYRLGMLSQSEIDAIRAKHPVSVSTFPDVPDGAWYQEYVELARYYGWINGYPDGSFRPQEPVTRGMFVTMLYRMDGDKEFHALYDGIERWFTDVDENAYYAEASLWAACKEITKGTASEQFSPQLPITREQTAAMFYRYLNYRGLINATVPTATAAFADADDVAVWAKDAVAYLQRIGAIEGNGNGLFLPKHNLTRAECAKLLWKLYSARTASTPGGVTELTAGTVRGEVPAYSPDADDADRDAAMDFCMALAANSLSGTSSEVLSPLSALYALGMTASGARGQTRAQLAQAFGLTPEQLNAYLRWYADRMHTGSGNAVRLADSVWINAHNSFDVSPDYLQTLVDYYDAPAFRGAFDESMRQAINAWIEQNTDGMIREMLQEIDPFAALYLVNTLTVSLRWQDPYGEPQEGSFTCADGTVQTCSMLCSTETVYLQDADTVGFLKSYESRYAFVALLPDETVPLQAYLASLSGEKLRGLLGSREEFCLVHTKLPAFTTDSAFELSTPLRALGVEDLFDPDACDLSGIGGELFVSGVLQNVHIQLDKDGTEAAAATIVEVAPGCAEPPDEIREYTVELDRPFVYLIIDRINGMPLFVGVVTSID